MIDLYQGDCMEYVAGMYENQVHMTLTDIPYGEVNRVSNGLRALDNKAQADTLDIDLDTLVDAIVRVTAGSIYMFCGIDQISPINVRLKRHGLSTRLCIWHKPNPSPMNGEHIWESGLEACVYGKKPGGTFKRHCQNTLWKWRGEPVEGHATPKPVGLFKYLIESSSNPGDIIFDPFAGSGTTGVAAKLLNRQFIGCEIYPAYHTLALERIGATQGGDIDTLFDLPKKNEGRAKKYLL